MAENKLTELTDTIDRLVSEARTTMDRTERALRIQEALALACQMITRLNRRLKRDVKHVLQDYGFGEAHADIAFRVVADGNDELAHFQSKEAMLDFLDASIPLLVGQCFLSKKKIQEILAEVSQSYEHFMDQRVGYSNMCKQFDRLNRFYCRPPYDGCGGGPVLDGGGPDGGPSGACGEKVCLYLLTFAAIGNLIASVIPLFLNASSGPIAQAKTPELRTVSLLSLLLLSSYSDMLDEREDIPLEAYVPENENPVRATAGAHIDDKKQMYAEG